MNANALIFISIVGFVIVVIAGSYNSLVHQRNKVKEAFSGVHVQLKRRADLIPNLVNTVKGYAKHERKLFENITKLRTALINLPEDDHKAISEINSLLDQGLQRILFLAEEYPRLQASENFLELQKELSNTEDQIAASRRIYNSNVNDYNTSIQQFPVNVLAGLFGFKDEAYFEACLQEGKNDFFDL